MKMAILFPMLTCSVMILMGAFIFLKPALTIEIQRRFYEKINWRIEPISMSKELRNTQIMGAFLIVVAVLFMLHTLYQTMGACCLR